MGAVVSRVINGVLVRRDRHRAVSCLHLWSTFGQLVGFEDGRTATVVGRDTRKR